MPQTQTDSATATRPRRTKKAKPGEETMKQTAEREALEAEAEAQANGVTAEPGEQGIATQDEEAAADDGPEPFVREASETELDLAGDLYLELEGKALDLGAEKAVEMLCRVVDVHTSVCMPVDWPGGEEPYRESHYLGWIGRILARACPKIEVSPGAVLFWWKNVKSWTKKGVPVRAIGRPTTAGESFLSEGSKAVVIGSFQMFRIMNTQQRVAAVYHALRALSAEGQVRPPQFSGYFDELSLFGVGTFEDDALLIRAVEAGLQVELPWSNRLQTNLFDQAAKVDPESAPDADLL